MSFQIIRMNFFNLMFLLSCCASVIYFLLKWYIQRVYSFWKRHNIVSVKPTFPFGNLKVIFRDEHLSETLATYYRQNKHATQMVGLYFFFEPMLLITDLDLAQKILTQHFQHFQCRTNIFDKNCDPLAANLFNVDYDTWRPLRMKLAPTLNVKRIKLMFSAIVNETNEFVTHLKDSMVSNGPIEMEISEWITRFAMDVTDGCILGLNRRTLNNPTEKLYNLGKHVVDRPNMTPYRNAIITQFDSVIKLIGFRTHHKEVTTYFFNIVKQAVAHRERNNLKRNDLMDTLIKMKNTSSNQLSIEELAAQAYVFFLGGFISTSSTLIYCLYELSMKGKTQIQDKARREINSILEKHNGQLTYKSLKEMVYIEQIIQGDKLKFY